MEQQDTSQPDQKRSETAVTITTAGKEYLPQAAQLISKTFVDDPVLKFLLSSLPENERVGYLPNFINSVLKAASLNGAIFQEANDWSCAAVWMPPGKRPDNTFTMIQAGILGFLWKVGIGGCRRLLLDFQRQSDKCKRKGLRDSDGKPIHRYHYLFFIATDFPFRGQGVASEVVRRYQKQATEDGLPIWLESTTPESRRIYIRLGFETVEIIRLGKGTHAESGVMESGGPGVPSWAMIWHPQSAVKDKSTATADAPQT